MKTRPTLLALTAVILLAVACKKDKNALQIPELVWSVSIPPNELTIQAYADAAGVYSFAKIDSGLASYTVLIARNKSDGAVIWRLPNLTAAGVFYEDVFVAVSYGLFIGVDLHTGQKLWEKNLPNTSLAGHFGETFFLRTTDVQFSEFKRLDARTGEIRPLQAFVYPDPAAFNSQMFGRVNAAGDTILYQVYYLNVSTPQYFLNAWNLSAGSLQKEILLAPSSGGPLSLRLEVGGDNIISQEGDGIARFDAETLAKRWSLADKTGEIALIDDLLLHKSQYSDQVDVLDAATGASFFSLLRNPGPSLIFIPGTLPYKTAQMQGVVYNYTDGKYNPGDPFGSTQPGWVENARLQARPKNGDGLRWDQTLTAEQGGLGLGVLCCDATSDAVFVFTANSVQRYKPAE